MEVGRIQRLPHALRVERAGSLDRAGQCRRSTEGGGALVADVVAGAVAVYLCELSGREPRVGSCPRYRDVPRCGASDVLALPPALIDPRVVHV
eukprot:scaffold114196_cov63-Phaeocystis_antarctica.AAC.7